MMRPPRRVALRRIALFLAAAACVVGCGGHMNFWPGGDFGWIEVRNDPTSTRTIHSVEVLHPPSPAEHYDLDLAPGQWTRLAESPGVSEVDLDWSDLTIEVFPAVVVVNGVATPVTGMN